jgi:phage terminase large subunit
MAIISQIFNKIYAPVFSTQCRYIDIWGGRGRGGSHFATDYFLHKITQPHYFRGYFVRQAFNDIRDSLFRDIKDRIADNDTIDDNDFDINESQMRITYKPTGNMIISKGVRKEGNRTAKLKSLAGATHVLVEEADELGEDDFDQMDLSLRSTKAHIQIFRVFNPPHKQHWIWRDYTLVDAEKPEGFGGDKFPYFKAVPKEQSNLCSVFSTYKNNLNNIDEGTAVKFESFKKNKPEYYYTVVCGYISEGMKGRIYSGWNTITDAEFNAIDAPSIIGIDFGVTTGGIVEVKIVKNNLYVRELYYGGATDKEIAMKLARLGITQQHNIIADSADPLKIARLRRGWNKDELIAFENGKGFTEEEILKYPVLLNGFTIYGVAKPPGSVKDGIGLIQDYNVFATDSSANIWNEYINYKWGLDKNKNPTDDPEDDNNHLMDPTRYVAMSKGRYF